MKTRFKFQRAFSLFQCLLTLAVLALVGLATVPALADDAGLVSFGAPATITNNAANTGSTGSAVKIDKQHGAALILKFSGDQAGTGNVWVQLARSYDGTTVESSPPATLRFTNALAGATTVVGYHEISPDLIRSAHSLKITSINNNDANAKGTNAVIGLLKKLER